MNGYLPPLGDTLRALGDRARKLRLLREITQDELGARAGVSGMTVRRFERTGVASIENVLRIAMALQAEPAFDQLFALPAYASLEDLDERPAMTTRKRAPRSK